MLLLNQRFHHSPLEGVVETKFDNSGSSSSATFFLPKGLIESLIFFLGAGLYSEAIALASFLDAPLNLSKALGSVLMISLASESVLKVKSPLLSRSLTSGFRARALIAFTLIPSSGA